VIGETMASVDPRDRDRLRDFGVREVAGDAHTAPPGGAGALNVTRACVEAPPETLLGCGSSQNKVTPVGGVATTRKLWRPQARTRYRAARGRASSTCPARDRTPACNPTADVLDQEHAEGAGERRSSSTSMS